MAFKERIARYSGSVETRIAEHASVAFLLKTLLQVQIGEGRDTRLRLTRDSIVAGAANARIIVAGMFHEQGGQE